MVRNPNYSTFITPLHRSIFLESHLFINQKRISDKFYKIVLINPYSHILQEELLDFSPK